MISKEVDCGVYEIKTYTVRLATVRDGPQMEIDRSSDAAKLAREIFDSLDSDQEHFVLMSLNCRKRLLSHKLLFSGGQDASTVDLRVLFRAALLSGASSIVIAHNHPSGDPSPSREDQIMTGLIDKAAKIIGIGMTDHVILGESGYYSFAEQGLLG